jgi:hypothetical protein
MLNVCAQGLLVDLYVPRKCSATSAHPAHPSTHAPGD